jgi:hypothetical protein
MGRVSDRQWATPHRGEKGSLSFLAGAAVSETGTASRIPLRERLEKCFGILFRRTRMPRLDGGAVAAENYRYVWKAGRGRGIDRCLGASGHTCMWDRADRNGRRLDCATSIVARSCEQFYTDATCRRAHPPPYQATILKVTPHRNTSGEWRGPCTIHDATAKGPQSACWRLKEPPSLITANSSSRSPSHGSPSPARMRQWTGCLRVGTRPSPSKQMGWRPKAGWLLNGPQTRHCRA